MLSLKRPSSLKKETTILFRFNICICVCACLLPSLSQESSGLGILIFYFPRSHISRHTQTRGNVDSYDRVVRCPHKPLFTHQNTNTRDEVGWNRTRDRRYRAGTDLRIVARGNRDRQLLHLAYEIIFFIKSLNLFS